MAGKLGTEKVFENDKVIVWNFELAPGDETEVHTHEHDYMWYAIQGTTLHALDENDEDLGIIEVPTGAVFSLKVDGDEIEVLSEAGKGMRLPARHKARNVGSSMYREVLVEYK
jgi:mannose-6-phosphate isomerase-like protein (cupin superfamily)